MLEVFLSLVSNSIFAGHRIPGWLFLKNLKVSLHYLLACIISEEKSAVTVIFIF